MYLCNTLANHLITSWTSKKINNNNKKERKKERKKPKSIDCYIDRMISLINILRFKL